MSVQYRTPAFLILCMFMAIAQPASAALREGARERFFERVPLEEHPAGPEIFTFEGNVHCKDHGKGLESSIHEGCEIEFTRSDGQRFALKANAELAKAVCEKHSRHLKIEISGEKESSFLFWGGGLKVTDYKVLGEMPEGYCAAHRDRAEPQSQPTQSRFRGRSFI